MPNEDFTRLAYFNDRIEDLAGLVDWRKATNEELLQSQVEINMQLAELRKKVDALLEIRRPIDTKIDQNKMAIRTETLKRENLERERARLLAEIAARERLLAQRNLLVSSTANKPWAVGVDGKKALPHQIEGAHRLTAAKRGLLGDSPGLGKTLQAIMTVDMLRAEGAGQKVLIFTPKPVVQDFERAFKKWTDPTLTHVLNQTIKGIKTDILQMVRHIPQIILITNYEVWRKDKSIHRALIDCGFDTVIMDEAHVMKGWGSKVTQEVREIIYAENRCPVCGNDKFDNRGIMDRICLSCEKVQEKEDEFCSVKNVYPLTGTPILNRPLDLFPPLNMMDRRSFPSEKSFLADYCQKEYDYTNGKWIYTFGAGGSERLLKKLGMRYTARTPESAGVVMPPQEIKHHWLELDPEKYPRQYKFIKQLKENAKLAFAPDVEITQEAVLAWYMRMRQAASWPDGIKIRGCACDSPCEGPDGLPDVKFCNNVQVIFPPEGTPPIGESVMMDAAEDIVLEAINEEQRIVVFSMFKSVINELERRCQSHGIRVGKIMGGVKESLRQEYIDDFNTNHTKIGEHKYDVLICQYQTADTGLNLNGAQQNLMIERQWNPGKEQQALKRTQRLDSQFETIAHLLHCEGTATDLIDAIVAQKEAMLEGFQADVDLAEAMRKFLES